MGPLDVQSVICHTVLPIQSTCLLGVRVMVFTGNSYSLIGAGNEVLETARWPNGFCCPQCGVAESFGEIYDSRRKSRDIVVELHDSVMIFKSNHSLL